MKRKKNCYNKLFILYKPTLLPRKKSAYHIYEMKQPIHVKDKKKCQTYVMFPISQKPEEIKVYIEFNCFLSEIKQTNS